MSPTRAERAERKREQILSGAAEVILARGFKGASTDVIARTAEVSKQTLYAYYPTKAQLLVDVMHELVYRLPDGYRLAGDEPDVTTREDLRSAVAEVVDHFADAALRPAYLGLVRIVVSESADQPELSAAFRDQLAGAMLDRVAGLVDVARRNGVLPDDGDPTMLARMLVGPLVVTAIIDGVLATDASPRAPDAAERTDLVERWLRAAGATG
jgi:AcrR family transcriptional regulator